MLAPLEVELTLHRSNADMYSVTLRCALPEGDGYIEGEGEAQFILVELRNLWLDPVAYGRALAKSLWSDAKIKDTFEQARAAAQTRNLPLRVRLAIGTNARELHGLRWETIRDPQVEAPLCTGAHLFFSRYLSSLDWRPVQLRPQGELHALAAIANPHNLPDYKLAPIDVPGEMRLARAGLGDIGLTQIAATLDSLLTALRETPCDVLYLVCHGALIKDEAWLWLEDGQGNVARVSGAKLAEGFRDLPQCPRLVALVSCQGAGSGTGETLAALGPRLAQAGVPAVLAMQGNLSMETAAQFMPVFFKELQQHGELDRALAVARGAVRERPDCWMPVLFMRLKSGQLWYTPGFGTGEQDFDKWESLKGFILEQNCTPFIGPGLAEEWLGSPNDLAKRWAGKYHFPFMQQEQDSMPRVAQYIVRRDGPVALRQAFRAAIREEIMGNYGAALPPELTQESAWPPDKILKALEVVATQCWAANANDAHRLLARLRLPLYITANPGNLLKQALVAAGAQPQERLCPWWSDRLPESDWRFDDEPTPEKPLIYYFFGHLAMPESLVLSEDDYLDFLLGVARNKTLIPAVVRARLTNTALLFLGFGLDDWSLRVLFRLLQAQEGKEQMKGYSHIAAQFEPDDSRLLDPRRARRYLEQYFMRENISIYWGRPAEFLRTLLDQLHR